MHLAEVLDLALHPERAPEKVKPERAVIGRPLVPAHAPMLVLVFLALLSLLLVLIR